MPTDPLPEIQLRPGDSVTITCQVQVTAFRWPTTPFKIVCDAPQPLYRDPQMKIPATTVTGQPRTTTTDPMDVFAIFIGERALLVFPYPSLWLDGNNARVVLISE